MDLLSNLAESREQPTELSHLQNHFLDLVRFAETNLPEESCVEVFRGCLELLKQALVSVRETTEINHQLARHRTGLHLVERELQPCNQQTIEQQLNTLPSHGDLVLDFGVVRRLSSAIMARCLEARQQLRQRGGRLVLQNVGRHMRHAFEVTELDRVFEIHYCK